MPTALVILGVSYNHCRTLLILFPPDSITTSVKQRPMTPVNHRRILGAQIIANVVQNIQQHQSPQLAEQFTPNTEFFWILDNTEYMKEPCEAVNTIATRKQGEAQHS